MTADADGAESTTRADGEASTTHADSNESTTHADSNESTTHTDSGESTTHTDSGESTTHPTDDASTTNVDTDEQQGILAVDRLTHRYGTEQALDDVSFAVEAGEAVAVVGPSGCGKTTLVQAISGHLSPSSGQVRLRGEEVTDQPPEQRAVGLVFQTATLYPHMTVGENVAYGLGPQGIDPDEQDGIVADYLSLVDLATQRQAHPAELSGGQTRRVELARALAPQPDLLLLDEPLSALDRSLRLQLRAEIARIQRETGVTMLFVTHNQEDAMGLADRLIVMNDGAIEAIGQPRQLYESPPTPFVASFLGRATELAATVVDSDPLRIAVGEERVTLPAATRTPPADATLRCLLRPRTLSLAGDNEHTGVALSGTVQRVADLGRRYTVTVRTTDGTEIRVEQTTAPPAEGDAVTVTVPRESLLVFTAAGNPVVES